MTIVAIIGVAALAAFAANLRTAARVRQMLPAAALAQERLATLDLIDGRDLRVLPDSLARGKFASPFDRYTWRAKAREVREQPALVEIIVYVEWDEGAYSISKRRYRPEVGGVAR
jgi:hypothetical protein